MHTEAILDSIEQAVENQLALGGEGLEEAGAALLTALRPALHQAVFRIAEQAAAEVAAQLDGYSVSVVLEEDEPSLLVREDAAAPVTTDDLTARITLRLSDSLKAELEDAAGEVGESVNTFVVKALSSRPARKRSRRITETFET